MLWKAYHICPSQISDGFVRGSMNWQSFECMIPLKESVLSEVNLIRIDGRVDSKERQDLVETFQYDEDVRYPYVILCYS